MTLNEMLAETQHKTNLIQALCEKLTLAQVWRHTLPFWEIRNSLLWAKQPATSLQSEPYEARPHPISVTHIWTFLPSMALVLQKVISPTIFLHKHMVSPMRSTFPALISFLNFIFMQFSPSSCHFLPLMPRFHTCYIWHTLTIYGNLPHCGNSALANIWY